VITASLSMRAAAAALGGVLALGALTGCSDDGSDEADADEPTTEPTATETTSAAPTDYLTVPTGVTLTEPGTDLGLTETASVAWEPRQGVVVALDLAVDRIDETSFKESFEGWVVTRQMKGQTPYFVHVTATNVGDAPVGGLLVPLYALAGGSSLYEPLDFRDETFEPCPGGKLPKRLKPGKTADLCFVYLLPQVDPFMSAAFDPVGDLAPVTWTGEITEIEKPKKDEKKRAKNPGNEQRG
jgi:hypothetical protein